MMKKISTLSPVTRIILASFQAFFIIALLGAILFVSASTIQWFLGWMFIVVYLSCSWLSTGILFLRVPALMEERNKKHHDRKKWDNMLVLSYQAMYFPVLIISGIDERFSLSSLPLLLSLVALLLIIFSFILMTWAPLVNTHLETYIRIQHDRNHTVCDKGPYQFIRHPAYLGLILLFLAMPVALNSWYGIIPSVIAAILIVIRTWLEDSILQKELTGYSAYAKKVKYRLLFGIW